MKILKKLLVALCMMSLGIAALAQVRISGTIKDVSGQPVIGAGVVVQGTTLGTSSDTDGSFSFSVPANAVLEVSSIGYETLTVRLSAGQTRLDLIMQEDKNFLDEVVVIGYGTVKKRDLTGSVAHVKSEDVVAIPTTNALEALQGKIAGLDMVKSSGQYEMAKSYSELVDINTCNGLKENIFVCNYASQANNNFNNSITQGPNGENMTIRNGGNNSHMFFSMTHDNVTDRNGEKPVNRCIEYARPFNRFMPTLFFLDLFDETIDSRYDALIRQEWICNRKTSLVDIGEVGIIFTKYDVPAEVKEASKAVILDRSSVYNPDGTIRNGKFHTAFVKFEDPTRAAVNDQHSGRDCVIIRLAEMYFIAAEASMNLNKPAEAAEYLNVIRRRAAIPGHEKEMEITAADVNIDFILDERGREMAGEMTRWFDLVRTGKLLERVKAHNPNAKDIAEFHTLRPIPQATLDAITNPDEFVQNPGY